MYDVNNHPKQEEINNKIGMILSDTVKKLANLSTKENIDARSLAQQFSDCFLLMMEKYINNH